MDAIKYIFTKRIQVDGETLVEDVKRSDFTPQEYLVEVVSSPPLDAASHPDSPSSDSATHAHPHAPADNAEDDPDQPIRMKERIVETGEGKYRQRWRRTPCRSLECSAERSGQLPHPAQGELALGV